MPFKPDYNVPLERQAYTIEGNGRIGCLMLHGFMGSPVSSRPMAEYLGTQGITVHCPLLPGHGHFPNKLRHVSHRDWIAEAEEGLAWLRPRCEELFILSHSMGTILGAHLILQGHDIRGQVMLAPVYDVPDSKIRLLRHLRLIMPWFYPHKMRRMQKLVRQRVLEFDPTIDFDAPEIQAKIPELTRVPTACFHEMTKMIDYGRTLWPRLTLPIVVFQGGHDQAATMENSQQLYEQLPAKDKTQHIYPEGSHELMRPFDPAHEEVWPLVYQFIQSHSQLAMAPAPV